jgi:hypothetical protein
MEVLEVSSTRGEGLDRWIEWAQKRQQQKTEKLLTALGG